MGLEAMREGLSDPTAMKETLQMLKDPETMAEVKKMMNDPKFIADMERLKQDPKFVESMKHAHKMASDPQTAGRLTRELKEEMLAARREDTRSDAEIGLAGLASASQDPRILKDAMDSLKDPSVRAEVEKMMKDPKFREEMERMKSDPTFRRAMETAMGKMEDISKYPVEQEKLKRKAERMGFT
jgi:tripartite-type tricarboxylate transporter receptor subunit TctC